MLPHCKLSFIEPKKYNEKKKNVTSQNALFYSEKWRRKTAEMYSIAREHWLQLTFFAAFFCKSEHLLTCCVAGRVVRIHVAGVQREARHCETDEAGGLQPTCHHDDAGSWISRRQHPHGPQWHCCLSARRWPRLPLESWAPTTENQRHLCMFSSSIHWQS